MIHLEIEHPERERIVLPLRDGVYLFPPIGSWEQELLHGRLRVVVRARQVGLQSLDGAESLHRGPERLQSVQLAIGESVTVGPLRLTVRSTSRDAAPQPTRARRASATRVMSVEGAHSSGSAFAAPVSDPEPTAGFERFVRGRDRWILMSIYRTGRIGRRALGRVVTAYRNPRIAGTARSIPEILSKSRLLGGDFDAALAEADAGWCLSCPGCHRVFEPEGRVVETYRCLECDRRLACVPKTVEEVASSRRSPAQVNVRYDRLPSGVRLGNYRIEELLGVGGFGAVYQAVDTHIERRVALKVFPSADASGDDVLSEARNVASFPPHANLVMVYHVGRALGLDYICYEYVAGRSLAYHIERGTKLSIEQSLFLFRDALRGLAAAHKFGVIHRDLKPDNILLVQISGKYRAKVTDFGLGKRLKPWQEGYHSRTIRGAPEYLAPEQFRSQLSSVASDLYSLGATFFHLFTGRQPYLGYSDLELAERHQEDPVPSLENSLVGCPASLNRLFQRLLAKDPKDRPSSAVAVLEFVREIDAQVSDERSEATRRHGSHWVAGGTVVLVLAALVMIGADRWWPRSSPPETERRSGPAAAGITGGPGAPLGAEGEVGSTEDGAGTSREPFAPPSGVQRVSRSRTPLPSRHAALEITDDPDVPTGEGDWPTDEGAWTASSYAPQPDPIDDVDASASRPGASGSLDPRPVIGAGNPTSGGASPVAVPQEPSATDDPLSVLTARIDSFLLRLDERGLAHRDLAHADPLGEGFPDQRRVLAVRRLALVDELLRDCRRLPGSTDTSPAYLQSFAQRSITPLSPDPDRPRRGSHVSTARQVEARLGELRELVRAVELDDWIDLRLPRVPELLSSARLELDGPSHADNWEWIDEEARTVLFVHSRGRVREGSDAPGFTRASTFRLRIGLRDVETLSQLMVGELQRLGE